MPFHERWWLDLGQSQDERGRRPASSIYPGVCHPAGSAAKGGCGCAGNQKGDSRMAWPLACPRHHMHMPHDCPQEYPPLQLCLCKKHVDADWTRRCSSQGDLATLKWRGRRPQSCPNIRTVAVLMRERLLLD